MSEVFYNREYDQSHVDNLYALLAAAALEQGGRLTISDRALLLVRDYSVSVESSRVRREIVIEVQLRKEPDVQDHHAEERRGQVVLDSDRAERPDTGDQSGVSNQGLLPAYGTEGDRETENESDC